MEDIGEAVELSSKAAVNSGRAMGMPGRAAAATPQILDSQRLRQEVLTPWACLPGRAAGCPGKWMPVNKEPYKLPQMVHSSTKKLFIV